MNWGIIVGPTNAIIHAGDIIFPEDPQLKEPLKQNSETQEKIDNGNQ